MHDNFQSVFAEAQVEVHQVAINHGWYDTSRSIGDMIALVHSELSEALEDYRGGHPTNEIRLNPKGKPEGFPTELADAVIRLMDMAAILRIDLGKAIAIKHEYNKSRPYRHGNKLL